MVAFTKPSLSIDDQLSLLVSRGLIVPDNARAKRYLTFINYYRLGGYYLQFCLPGCHDFIPGTTFDSILDLYIFDRKLRLLAMDAIERVEIAIRSAIINVMSEAHGPHWFMDSALFDQKTKFDHAVFLEQIKKDTGYYDSRKRGVSISHYYTKYTTPDLPPSWMIGDALTFGTWSFIYLYIDCLQSKKHISSLFSLRHYQLSSWMHALSFVRNVCAHHSKLWDRIFTVKPMIIPPITGLMTPNTTVYSYCAMMHYILKHITNASKWSNRLYTLILECPLSPQAHMGFPADWHLEPFWQISPSSKGLLRKRSRALSRMTKHH